MGVHNFISFLEGAMLICSSTIVFGTLDKPPIESASLVLALIKQKKTFYSRAHLFSLYPLELNFGQTVWDKTEVLFGTLGEQLGNLDNPMGNTLRTRGKTIHLPQKKKNSNSS
jgi:hypothetical protein